MSGSSPMLSGCRGPTDHRRKRAGGTADDDVLWRTPLQPHRVHDDVEENGEGEQRRGFKIDRKSKDCDCADAQDQSECKRFRARHHPAGNRAPRGTACTRLGARNASDIVILT